MDDVTSPLARPTGPGWFEHVALGAVDAPTARERARTAKAGNAVAARALAAATVHVAAVDPTHLAAVFDGMCAGWTGSAPAVAPTSVEHGEAVRPGAPTTDWWDAFWSLVTDPATGSDAGDITTRTAALAGQLDPSWREALAASAAAWPGVADMVAAGWPEPFRLDDLAACPAPSVGHDLYRLVVDQGFDLEVLDRSTLGLDELPEPLGHLNARILQCHDVWHLVGGYATTILHEVAISAFQLGQFGHHYSAMFLAVTLTKAATERPEGLPLLLDTVTSAWRHGRETPPLLPVAWPAIWHLPVEAVRERLGVRPYESPWPADIVEQLMSA